MSNKEYLYEKVLICPLGHCQSGKKHLMHAPILLPCGFTSCSECFDAYKRHNFDENTNQLACPFNACNSIHIIKDFYKLPKNAYLIDLLDQNLKHIAKDLLEKEKIVQSTIKKGNHSD